MEQLIRNFLNRIKKENNLIEAVCLSNKDGIIFKEQLTPRNYRNIYSHSKSFTSLMVGIAIDEKMIALDTKLVDVFKDEIDKETYERLYEITVKHLLTMSSGFGKEMLMGDQRRNGQGYPDYLKYVLSQPLITKPGTIFKYSNGDTYLLGRIIAKVYNQSFYQLCYEKIFKPLEIGLPMWGSCPMGYCICASDLQLSVEDMNKLGILFINKGVYKGKRIISSEYVDMCSKEQIKTDGWGNYSFQFWMTPEGNGYRADGAYGQYTFIWPKQNIVFSIQRGEDNRYNEFFKILKEEVLDKIS